MISQCIILAGGLGTRLRAAVPDLPKCMAPVAGKPFLYYVVQHFLAQGVDQFIFSLGYMHEVMIDYLQRNYSPAQFSFVIEDEPLGTGGAIRLACAKANGQHVLVTNGDTLFRVNAAQLSSFHMQQKADCTLCLRPMEKFDRYGVVELNRSNNRITSFREKQFYESGLINGGVYALQVDHFVKKAWPEKFSFEKDYLENYYTEEKVYGQVQDEYFIDIGIPEDYAKAQVDFEKMKL
jgi:D-glycero-alpha-D-manno-heptose 1-phosphate guanylyltransferase